MDTRVDDVIVIHETSLAEQVRRKLQIDIVSGEVPPGCMLSVPALAEHLGISSSPVREALIRLAADGLLQPKRNRGFVVVTPTVDDLRHMFEVRLELETLALVKLVQAGLPDAGALTTLADEITDKVRTGDVPGYLTADRAFHEALMDSAGNPVLTRMVMKLRDGMRLYGIRSEAGAKRQAKSVDEHYAMIELAKGHGSKEEVVALMRQHIMEWEPIFVEAAARAQKQRMKWALP